MRRTEMNNEEKILTKLEQIGSKIESMDARFDGMDARFDGIDYRLDGMDARFDKLENRMESKFDQIDARFDKLENRMESKFDQIDANFEEIRAYNVRIETEYWPGIKVALEEIQGAIEKNKEQDNIIYKLKDTVVNHGIRLSLLENAVNP